jgi:hypothetical protein
MFDKNTWIILGIVLVLFVINYFFMKYTLSSDASKFSKIKNNIDIHQKKLDKKYTEKIERLISTTFNKYLSPEQHNIKDNYEKDDIDNINFQDDEYEELDNKRGYGDMDSVREFSE